MKIQSLLLSVITLSCLTLAGCGAFSALGQASRDSAALQVRDDVLRERLDDLEKLLDAYGPLAKDLGPEIREKYAKLQEEYQKVRSIAEDVVQVHNEALAKATGPDGEVDWMMYLFGALLGGGQMYNKRRDGQEKNVLHARVDSKSDRIRDLENRQKDFEHALELAKAKLEKAS